MKISNASKNRQQEADFDAVVKDLMSKHEVIFFADIGGYNFIYRPLNRKEYKSIILNNQLEQIEKEDEIIEATLLYPTEIDLDEIEAGIPSLLYEQILDNSFLRADQILQLLNSFREELQEMDSQMTCIIAEAFPNYRIEEIEEWDMIKFCKMFVKAEYNLTTFRNLELQNDLADFLRANIETDDEEEYYEDHDENDEEYVEQKPSQHYSDGSAKIKVGSREMTESEYKQYLDFRKMYPDIDWDADAMFTGYESQSASTVPVALR